MDQFNHNALGNTPGSTLGPALAAQGQVQPMQMTENAFHQSTNDQNVFIPSSDGTQGRWGTLREAYQAQLAVNQRLQDELHVVTCKERDLRVEHEVLKSMTYELELSRDSHKERADANYAELQQLEDEWDHLCQLADDASVMWEINAEEESQKAKTSEAVRAEPRCPGSSLDQLDHTLREELVNETSTATMPIMDPVFAQIHTTSEGVKAMSSELDQRTLSIVHEEAVRARVDGIIARLREEAQKVADKGKIPVFAVQSYAGYTSGDLHVSQDLAKMVAKAMRGELHVTAEKAYGDNWKIVVDLTKKPRPSGGLARRIAGFGFRLSKVGAVAAAGAAAAAFGPGIVDILLATS